MYPVKAGGLGGEQLRKGGSRQGVQLQQLQGCSRQGGQEMERAQGRVQREISCSRAGGRGPLNSL